MLSGMNDAGLALAVLECYSANDNSAKFDPEGTPYALCFRRLLEECTTVAEAEKLLKSLKRTTRINLAICDKKGGAVFEITPKTVVVRPADKGLCPCTNHFRTDKLCVDNKCDRYDKLSPLQAKDAPKLGVKDVFAELDKVHQGKHTLQCMVFEPGERVLHLLGGERGAGLRRLARVELAGGNLQEVAAGGVAVLADEEHGAVRGHRYHGGGAGVADHLEVHLLAVGQAHPVDVQLHRVAAKDLAAPQPLGIGTGAPAAAHSRGPSGFVDTIWVSL